MSLKDPKDVSRYSADVVLQFRWSRKGKDIWGGSANIPLTSGVDVTVGPRFSLRRGGAGKEEAGLGLVLFPKKKVIMLASLLLHPHLPLPALSTWIFSHFPSMKAVCLITHQR